MKFGLSPKSMTSIFGALSKFEQIDQAYIFGSRAMGNYKNGSDVDLALCGAELTNEILLQLGALLNEELPLPYQFDLVHYETIDNWALKQHIDLEGKLFYKRVF